MDGETFPVDSLISERGAKRLHFFAVIRRQSFGGDWHGGLRTFVLASSLSRGGH